MSELKISLNDIDSVKTGLTILQAIVDGGGKLLSSALHAAEDVTGMDINKDGKIGDDPIIDNSGSDLDDLFPEDGLGEPEALTIDSVKDAVTALAKAKGRDAAKTLLTKVLQKLKLTKLEEVPEDKFETIIDIMKKASA